MRFVLGQNVFTIWGSGLPLVCDFVLAAKVLAKRGSVAGGLSELGREYPKFALVVKFSASLCELGQQNLMVREVLQEGHDVGERLVEGEDVGIAGIYEIPVHAVEQGVRGFMGDNVVGEACEHNAAGNVAIAVAAFGGEVAEEEGFFVRMVVSVGLRIACG